MKAIEARGSFRQLDKDMRLFFRNASLDFESRPILRLNRSHRAVMALLSSGTSCNRDKVLEDEDRLISRFSLAQSARSQDSVGWSTADAMESSPYGEPRIALLPK